MGFLGQIGRPAMKNVAKFYVENQARWALGSVGTDALLPVYPRLLARDRKNKLNHEIGSRIVFNRSLQTTAESNRLNERSLTTAVGDLSRGRIVNIFPCGRIANTLTRPWRPGLGKMIGRLSEADRDDVLVVPYQADNIRRGRLLAAIVMRGRGVFGKPQNIELEFGRPRTATEVMAMIPEASQDDPAAITDIVRQMYMSSLVAPRQRDIRDN